MTTGIRNIRAGAVIVIALLTVAACALPGSEHSALPTTLYWADHGTRKIRQANLDGS